MFGLFTSDPIEKEFSKLVQGSGGTYFITVQQILEKVVIRNTKLLLQIGNEIDSLSCNSYSKCGFLLNESICEIIKNLPDLQKSLTKTVLMSLIYIAGYVEKKDDNCDSYVYATEYGNYLHELSREELNVPGDTIDQFAIYGYIFFYQVSEITCCKSFTRILMIVSDIYRLDVNRNHGFILSNVLFNNHCKLYSPRSKKEPPQKLFKIA